VNQIERRLRREPARAVRAHRPPGVHGLLVTNNDGLLAAGCSSGLRHELRVAALLQRQEPEDRLASFVSIRKHRQAYIRLTSSMVCPTVSNP